MKKKIFKFLFVFILFVTLMSIANTLKVNALAIKVGEKSYNSESSSLSSITMTTYLSSVKQEFAGLGSGMVPTYKESNYYSYNEIYIGKSLNSTIVGYSEKTDSFGNKLPIFDTKVTNFNAGTYSLSILSTSDKSHMRLKLIGQSSTRDLNMSYYNYANSMTFTCDFSSNESFYLVFYSSLGESKELSPITFSPITLEQLDNSSPVFESQVFITGTNSPVSLEYILSQVKFVDEVDGNIPVTKDNVTIDTYTSNKYNVGKWIIEVSASDRSNNRATGTIEVWVQDKTPPTITGITNFTSYMSSPLSEQYLKSTLIITDNHDTTFNINIIENTFNEKEHTLGTYKISYNVTDSNNNTSNTFTILITTIDDIKPTITGTNTYSSSYQTLIDIETIKNQLLATDNVTPKEQLNIVIKEDNYTSNFDKIGLYTLTLTVKDESNNDSDDFIVNIEVSDIVPPLFYTNNSFIGISKATSLSKEELEKILIDIEGITSTENTVEILSSKYNFQNENESGSYSVSYIIKNKNNSSNEIRNLTIKVYDDFSNTTKKIKQEANEDNISIFNRIKNFLKYLFVNLFKTIAFIFTFGKIKPNW